MNKQIKNGSIYVVPYLSVSEKKCINIYIYQETKQDLEQILLLLCN